MPKFLTSVGVIGPTVSPETGVSLSTTVPGEAFPRSRLMGDGSLAFGTGAAAPVYQLGHTAAPNGVALRTVADTGSMALAIRGAAGNANFYMSRQNGTHTTPTAALANETLTQVVFQGHDGSALATATYMSTFATEAWDTTHHGAALRFHTKITGTNSLVETARIIDRAVVIGSTPNATASVLERLRVNTPVTPDILAAVHLTAGAATTKPLVVMGAASQSASLTEWKTSAGAVLASVDNTGTITTGGFRQGPSGPTWLAGTGSPEAAVTAPIGSIFSRTDGAANTALYRKETGAGNTGWVAVAASAAAPVTSVDGLTGAVSLTSKYVDITGDTMTGGLTATDFGLSSARSSSIGKLATSVMPLMLGTWADRFQFATVQAAEYWNGSAWVAFASSDTIKPIFDGSPVTSVTLNSTTYPKWRVAFSGTSSSYANLLHIYQEYASGNPRTYKVTLEESADATTWTTLLAETTIAASPIPFFVTMPTAISYGAYIRVTIEHVTAGVDYAWRQIRFLSDRMNGQGGTQLGLPFTWNFSKSVLFPAGMTVAGSLTANSIYATQTAASTSAFSSPSALSVQNLNNTVGNWSELAFLGSGGGVVGGVSSKTTNHGSNYGEMWFYGRSASGFRPRLRIPETGGLDVYGNASTVVASISNAGTITVVDAGNLTLGTTTGTKIGTATTQKLGFWNATPVVQNTGWAITGGYTADKTFNPESCTLTEVARALGTLIDVVKSYGLLG